MLRLIATSLIALLAGCTAYATPGRGAQMDLFGASAEAQARGTEAGIQQVLDKKPLASFPASLAVVRVQAPGYVSYTSRGWGGGQYTILTTRDVERPEDVSLNPSGEYPGEIELSEPLGVETIVHIKSGTAEITCLAHGLVQLKHGDTVRFDINKNHLHYFDEQENRI